MKYSVRANQRVNANRHVTVSNIKCWKLTYLLTLLATLKHTWQITQRLARWWQQIIEIQVPQIISQTIIGVGRNCFLCLLPLSIHNFFNGHMNISRTKSMLGSSSWQLLMHSRKLNTSRDFLFKYKITFSCQTWMAS